MSELGHNNPPPSEAMSLHIEDLFQLVSDTTEGAEVTTDEQEAGLADLLKQVREASKDSEKMRKAEKEPHLEAGRAVDATWKPITDRCKAAADEIKVKLTPYRAAKQAAKDEAARKAREEAQAKEQAARAAIQDAESLDGRFEAEATLKEAAALKTAANKIDRAPTGLRTFKVVSVTDTRAALKWIMARDAEALDAFVTDYAERNARTRPMDGVTVTDEKRAA